MGIEEHRVLDIEGAQTIAILHRAGQPCNRGVVIVVGGPQYRVGSHRQFVRLAREIAGAGFDVLRFDVRGMGDGGGDSQRFFSLDSDIRHAVDELCRASPALKDVVLVGLCDGASAALMYAPCDNRISRLVLLNPWARNDAGAAIVRLRAYYLRRLFDADFWRKLVAGGVGLAGSIRDVSQTTRTAVAGPSTNQFLARMERAVDDFAGPILIVLSAADYTAEEFREWMEGDPTRNALFQRGGVRLTTIADANHTFSTSEWHALASREVVCFLRNA